MNAFTESLAVEMEPFGVRVHLVLPGRSPETAFGDNAVRQGLDNPAYAEMVQRMVAGMRDTSGPLTYSSDVAEAVWRAATDPSSPVRIPAGADAVAWANGD